MSVPQFKRLSANQQRDLGYSLKRARECPLKSHLLQPDSDHVSQSIEEWYFLWDTHGIISHFSDMRLAQGVQQAKDFSNLTVKMWVEDVEPGVVSVEEIWDWCHELPAWMWCAFKQQLNRLGLPFKFHRVESIPGKIEWLPPWMLEFDPSI